MWNFIKPRRANLRLWQVALLATIFLAALAARLTGAKRNEAYARALELAKQVSDR